MRLFIAVTVFLCAIGFANSHISLVQKLAKELMKEKFSDETAAFKCSLCLNVMDEGINAALNLILNAGVAATCQTGCAAIAQRFFNSSSTLEQLVDMVCTVGCLAVGMKEFIAILEKINLDPIYYCEEIDLCPYNDNGKAKIDKVIVSPLTGAQGTTFVILVDYTVINTTGTGDMVINIEPVDKIPLGDEFMLYQQGPGSYKVEFKVDATPNPDCNDPMCEQWLPGLYNIDLALCDGECSGKHPHSRMYGEAKANFTITG